MLSVPLRTFHSHSENVYRWIARVVNSFYSSLRGAEIFLIGFTSFLTRRDIFNASSVSGHSLLIIACSPACAPIHLPTEKKKEERVWKKEERGGSWKHYFSVADHNMRWWVGVMEGARVETGVMRYWGGM